MRHHIRSQAQIDASRINGAKSRGPVTSQGKAQCSRNATRHGLLANTILIKGESVDQFENLLLARIREFAPQTDSEMDLVEKMVVCKWREMRVWAMQAAALSEAIASQPEPDNPAARAWTAMCVRNRTMNSLHRYEAHFARQYSRCLRQLAALKALREFSAEKK